MPFLTSRAASSIAVKLVPRSVLRVYTRMMFKEMGIWNGGGNRYCNWETKRAYMKLVIGVCFEHNCVEIYGDEALRKETIRIFLMV